LQQKLKAAEQVIEQQYFTQGTPVDVMELRFPANVIFGRNFNNSKNPFLLEISMVKKKDILEGIDINLLLVCR